MACIATSLSHLLSILCRKLFVLLNWFLLWRERSCRFWYEQLLHDCRFDTSVLLHPYPFQQPFVYNCNKSVSILTMYVPQQDNCYIVIDQESKGPSLTSTTPCWSLLFWYSQQNCIFRFLKLYSFKYSLVFNWSRDPQKRAAEIFCQPLSQNLSCLQFQPGCTAM